MVTYVLLPSLALAEWPSSFQLFTSCSFVPAALHGIAGGYEDGQDGTPGESPIYYER